MHIALSLVESQKEPRRTPFDFAQGRLQTRRVGRDRARIQCRTMGLKVVPDNENYICHLE